jgi:cardiolipin synthase
MQGEVAAARHGVAATVLYTQASGPLKNRHARVLAEEAAVNSVRLIRTRRIPLHGKIVAWDDDDVVVTSLNWASAAVDPDFPWSDIGIHIQAPGVAAAALARFSNIFPEVGEEPANDELAAAAPRR